MQMKLHRMNQKSSILDRRIDVGIVTIIPSEVQAIFSVFGIDLKKYAHIDHPLDYWEASLFSHYNNRDIRVVVTFLSGTAGNTDSGITTALFLRDWFPRIMCLSGIAAGVEGKVRIGDVVLPDKIHDLCVTVRLGKKELPRDDLRHREVLIDRMLKLNVPSTDHLNAELKLRTPNRDDLITVARSKGLEEIHFNANVQIHDGSLVSGNRLLRDSGYLADIRHTKDEKCRCGEMEAAGFTRACEIESVPWLVVRGVSDFGDDRKDDTFQKFAAESAALCLHHILSTGIDFDQLPYQIPGSAGDAVLGSNIASELMEAYKAERWEQTVLIGSFLSRPLWLSGRYELRAHLGAIIEDAAAKSNKKGPRAAALIDDLGWTSFALNDEPSAIKYITDGLNLAKDVQDYYLIAKGHRHLASISRRKGDFAEAQRQLERAKKACGKIKNPVGQEEMATALLASEAKLLMSTTAYKEAEELLLLAKKHYESNNDIGRSVKIYVLLGDLAKERGRIEDAEKFYQYGYDASVNLGRKDETFNNSKGLAALYLSTQQYDRAGEWLRKAAAHAQALNMLEESRKLRLSLINLQKPQEAEKQTPN